MALGLGTALTGLGIIGKGITSFFQGQKANSIDRKNIRPIEEVQQEYFQNVSDAEQAARMGMPMQQYQQALQNQQRNLSGTVRALGRSGNPSAGLASLLRASNDATLSLDVNNAIQKRQNERNLYSQRGILAGMKQRAFDWNKKSPYLANFARAQALRGAAAQNGLSAFGDVQQLGMYIDSDGKTANGGDSGMAAGSGVGTGLSGMLNQGQSNPNYPTQRGFNSFLGY